MPVIYRAFLIAVLIGSPLLQAQEIKYIEFTFSKQRVELRHPPAPPAECKDGNCLPGGSFGVSVGDGAPDKRDPHALAIYLLGVSPTEIHPSEPLEVEFKVLNTGTVSIELPVYANLSDLQPDDESVAFSYFSLALVVRGESESKDQNVPILGYIELYGSYEHEGTIMTLRPGEWIRIRATMKLQTRPKERMFARLNGEFWLRKNTFRPQPGGEFTEVRNLYPNTTTSPSIRVHLLGSVASEQPKPSAPFH